jgi:hypothetical protein
MHTSNRGIMPLTDSTSRTLLESQSQQHATGHVGEQGGRHHQHHQNTDDDGFLSDISSP